MRIAVTEKGDWVAIRLRPVNAWAYWTFGLTFLALGLGALLLLGRGARLTCDADPAGECRLMRVVIAGWRVESFGVAELTGARVDTVRSVGTAWMNLVLETARGDRALLLPRADGDEKLRLAENIRRFVADPRAAPLAIAEDERPFAIPFAVIVVATGVVVILAMETVVVFADRSAGVLLIRGRRLFGRRSVEVRLDSVEEIATPSWYVRGAESFSVVLHLAGRREEALTRTPLFTAESARQVSETLTRFLWAEGLSRRQGRQRG